MACRTGFQKSTAGSYGVAVLDLAHDRHLRRTGADRVLNEVGQRDFNLRNGTQRSDADGHGVVSIVAAARPAATAVALVDEEDALTGPANLAANHPPEVTELARYGP